MMDSTSIAEQGVVVKVWGVELKGILLRLAQARNDTVGIGMFSRAEYAGKMSR